MTDTPYVGCTTTPYYKTAILVSLHSHTRTNAHIAHHIACRDKQTKGSRARITGESHTRVVGKTKKKGGGGQGGIKRTATLVIVRHGLVFAMWMNAHK